MKKWLLLSVLLVFTSPFSYALQAQGVIEEIRVCGYANTGGNRWTRSLQFKVNGLWFAILADYSGSSVNYFEHDNSLTASLVMMAYSQQKVVEVNATDAWNSNFSNCGASSSGAVFHDNPGDYIRLANSL